MRPLLAVLVAALAVAAPADAYVVGGRPWPIRTITYYAAASGYAPSIDRAARILNRAHVGIRLMRVRHAYADVTVGYGGSPCGGRAPIGFQRFRRVFLGRGCRSGLVTLTAVHEFGHVLGLDHEYRRCARMNLTFDQFGTPNRCARHRLSYWLKHPLTRDDRRGLRALYGS